MTIYKVSYHINLTLTLTVHSILPNPIQQQAAATISKKITKKLKINLSKNIF